MDRISSKLKAESPTLLQSIFKINLLIWLDWHHYRGPRLSAWVLSRWYCLIKLRKAKGQVHSSLQLRSYPCHWVLCSMSRPFWPSHHFCKSSKLLFTYLTWSKALGLNSNSTGKKLQTQWTVMILIWNPWIQSLSDTLSKRIRKDCSIGVLSLPKRIRPSISQCAQEKEGIKKQNSKKGFRRTRRNPRLEAAQNSSVKSPRTPVSGRKCYLWQAE